MKPEKKKKKWLTLEETDLVLNLARRRSQRDYLMFSLMRWGVRVGEIVGWRGLPGIRKGDLRENSIWIRGKGYKRAVVQDIDYVVDQEVLKQVHAYAAQLKPDDKVFPLSEPYVERLLKKYAREAGIEDWDRLGPHRLRAFMATDDSEQGEGEFTIRDHMRHRNVVDTNRYVGRITKGKMIRVVARLAARNSSVTQD